VEKKQIARRFEDFKVYKISKIVTKEMYLLTKENILNRDYSFSDQTRRAVVSVMSNIAEGYERGHRKNSFIFLIYLKGPMEK